MEMAESGRRAEKAAKCLILREVKDKGSEQSSLARALHLVFASETRQNSRRVEQTMSIQKKSLISTLHAAKKANLAKADVAAGHKGDKQVSAKNSAQLRAFAGISTRRLKTFQ